MKNVALLVLTGVIFSRRRPEKKVNVQKIFGNMPVRSNISVVFTRLADNLSAVSVDSIMRKVVLSVSARQDERIFSEGKNVKDLPIGEYSDKYILYTRRKYKRGNKLKKIGKRERKKKGIGKNKIYDHAPITADERKVILTLTSKMKNNYAPLFARKFWALGFTNKHEYQKSIWNEQQYGTVYGIAKEESKMINQIIDNEIKRLFK